MHTDLKGKKLRANARRILMSGEYAHVPTPYGRVHAYYEVELVVKVRLDPEGNDDPSWTEGGGYDVLGEQCAVIANRLCEIFATSSPKGATHERVAQIELFEGVEGR